MELQVRITLNLRAEFCHRLAEVTASKAGCGGRGPCCEQWHFLESALVKLQTHFVVKNLCIPSCLPIFEARSPVLLGCELKVLRGPWKRGQVHLFFQSHLHPLHMHLPGKSDTTVSSSSFPISWSVWFSQSSVVPPALKGLAVTREGLVSFVLGARRPVSLLTGFHKSWAQLRAAEAFKLSVLLFASVGVRDTVFVSRTPQHAPLLSVTGIPGLQILLLRA